MLIIWRKKISDFFYIPSVGEAKNYRHPTILVALFRTSNKFVNFSGIFCHRKMFHTILESDLMRMGTQIPDLFGHPALLHGIVSLFFLLSFECFFFSRARAEGDNTPLQSTVEYNVIYDDGSHGSKIAFWIQTLMMYL